MDADEGAYQQGIISPRLVEYLDTPTYRHYLYTMGNPALKVALDDRMKEKHRRQNVLDVETAKYIDEQHPTEQLEKLQTLEKFGSSTLLFQYGVLREARKFIDAEMVRIRKENEQLQKDINELESVLSDL